MKVDSVLLFLCILRYAYEKKPVQYAFTKALLETSPTLLPEHCRTPLQAVQWIDRILTIPADSMVRNVRVQSDDDPVRQLREFAARFI